MVQMGFAKPSIPRAPHFAGSNRLRNRTFNACSMGIFLLVILGRSSLTCLAQCIVLFLWTNTDQPSRILFLTAGAILHKGTRPAI